MIPTFEELSKHYGATITRQESTSVLEIVLPRRLRSVSAAAQAGMPGQPAA